EMGSGNTRLVDPTTGRELATLTDPDLDMNHLPIFTPDGTRLITVSSANGIHVWDLRLIRQRLKELGLDWDGKEYAPTHTRPAPMMPRQKVRMCGADRLTEWAPRTARAREHARATRWADAVAAYSEAIELQPEHGRSWSDRGVAFAELGQWEKAVADFEKAAQLMPNDPQVRYQLALVRIHLGERDAYRKVCSEMIERFGKTSNP